MKKADGGFLLADVVIATGLLAVIGLAASQALATADRGRLRAERDRLIAACAEEAFASLLLSPDVGIPGCGARISREDRRQPSDGPFDDMTVSLSADGMRRQTFSTFLHAR